MSRSYPVLILLLCAAFLISSFPVSAAYSPVESSAAVWRSACEVLNAGFYASPDCDSEMVTDPGPRVAPLAVDYGAVEGYTFMRIVADGPVTVYNSPDGTPLHTI